jgi:hypothetical protein
MKISELYKLATFETEVARGLLHTDEYRERMRLLREELDHESPNSEEFEAIKQEVCPRER